VSAVFQLTDTDEYTVAEANDNDGGAITNTLSRQTAVISRSLYSVGRRPAIYRPIE